MTLDLDAIAREVGLIELRDVWADLPADYTQALSRFAALLLENVAQNHDEAAKEWARMAEGCNSGMYDDKAMAAQQLADDVRQMAAGMGE